MAEKKRREHLTDDEKRALVEKIDALKEKEKITLAEACERYGIPAHKYHSCKKKRAKTKDLAVTGKRKAKNIGIIPLEVPQSRGGSNGDPIVIMIGREGSLQNIFKSASTFLGGGN